MEKTVTYRDEIERLRRHNDLLAALLKQEAREIRALDKECRKLLRANKFAREQAKRERKRFLDLLRETRNGRSQQCLIEHDCATTSAREYERKAKSAEDEGDKALAIHYWTCARQARRKAELALNE